MYIYNIHTQTHSTAKHIITETSVSSGLYAFRRSDRSPRNIDPSASTSLVRLYRQLFKRRVCIRPAFTAHTHAHSPAPYIRGHQVRLCFSARNFSALFGNARALSTIGAPLLTNASVAYFES